MHAPRRHGWKSEKFVLDVLGDVRSLKTTLCCVGKVEESSTTIIIEEYSYEMEFNKQGNVVAYREFDKNGNLCTSFEYEYHTKSDCVEMRELKNGELRCTTEWKYNSEGVCVEEKLYGLDTDMDRVFWSVSRYDSEGKIVEIVFYDEDNWPDSRQIYHYDSEGRREEMLVYDENDQLEYRTTYSYDSEGRLVEEMLVYDENDQLAYRTTYSYDSEGRLVEESIFDKDGNLEDKTTQDYDSEEETNALRTYNAEGQLESLTHRDSMGEEVKETYKYNEWGDCIERCVCGEKLRERTLWTYDKVGNLLESVHETYVASDVLSSSFVREITYWKE